MQFLMTMGLLLLALDVLGSFFKSKILDQQIGWGALLVLLGMFVTPFIEALKLDLLT